MKGNRVINITGKRAMREVQTILVCAIIFAIILLFAVCAYAADLRPTLDRANTTKLPVYRSGAEALAMKIIKEKNSRKKPMMSILPKDQDQDLVRLAKARSLNSQGDLTIDIERDEDGKIESITFTDSATPEVSVTFNNKREMTITYTEAKDQAEEEIAQQSAEAEVGDRYNLLLLLRLTDQKDADSNGDGVIDENGDSGDDSDDSNSKGLVMLNKSDVNNDVNASGGFINYVFELYKASDEQGRNVGAGGKSTFKVTMLSDKGGNDKLLSEEEAKKIARDMDFDAIKTAIKSFMASMERIEDEQEKWKRKKKKKSSSIISYDNVSGESDGEREESSMRIKIETDRLRMRADVARQTLGARLVSATGLSNVKIVGEVAYIGFGLPEREAAESEE